MYVETNFSLIFLHLTLIVAATLSRPTGLNTNCVLLTLLNKHTNTLMLEKPDFITQKLIIYLLIKISLSKK